MRNYLKYLAFLISLNAFIQTVGAQNYLINQTFTKDTILTIFDKSKTLAAIKLNADIKLNSSKSLVRVILVDLNKDENLIYETYYQLAESNFFSVNLASDETEFLNNVSPSYIKIQIIDANITIKSFLLGVEQSILKSTSVNANRSLSLKAKNKSKIDQLNNTLRKNNAKWRAGETNISNMTFKEKKAYFGLDNYNSHGLEYYVGGIFEFKDENPTQNQTINVSSSKLQNNIVTATSPYIDHFDWREKHGANNSLSPYFNGDPIGGWITPVKTQWKGTCWAYSAVGTTEALVNLYYNQHLDLDLSEHNIVSCTGGVSSSAGGWASAALNYIKNTGVVDETCFPNPSDAIQLPCSNNCNNPTEKIKIGGYSSFGFNNEDGLKKLIIKSPMTFSICCSYICHATVVIGYRIIKEGDNVYHSETSTGTDHIIIKAGDPLIGRLCWIIKNSGGGDNPTYGYSYYIIDNFRYIDASETCSVFGPITSLKYTANDIKCVDLDGDGYYNWGIGSKPSTCPICSSNEEDGDDSNSALGPIDDYGFCRKLTTSITYPTTTITSNTTWRTVSSFCGDLLIKSGATLTLTSTSQLTMPMYSTITIQEGAKLIINGGKITCANIIVKNTSNLTINSNGILEFYKNDQLSVELGATLDYNYGEIKILSKY